MITNFGKMKAADIRRAKKRLKSKNRKKLRAECVEPQRIVAETVTLNRGTKNCFPMRTQEKFGTLESEMLAEMRASSLKNEATEWLTTKQAAQFLNIPVRTLMNMSSNGKIPYYKLGRSNRYLKKELEELLLKNRRGGFYGN